MGSFSPECLPEDSERQALRRDAKTVLDAHRAFLASPIFQHRIDLAVLAKIAADERFPVRDRLRAAGILASVMMQTLREMAEIVCLKDLSKEQLGLGEGASAAQQINIHIGVPELVRPRKPVVAAPPPPALEAEGSRAPEIPPRPDPEGATGTAPDGERSPFVPPWRPPWPEDFG